MNIDDLYRFLLCSLAINYAVLLIWFMAFVFARDQIRALHGKWFRLSEGTFDAIHYGGMAAYKIGILFLNLAPLVALHFIRSGN